MLRNFYIIGHNPNSVQAAIKCLKAGANAIEPDIRYLPEYNEKFFVYDLATENPKKHTLKDYLIGLAGALNKEMNLNLALITFDLKPSYSKEMESYSLLYMEEIFRQLNEYFFKNYTSVPLLFTVGDPSGKPLLSTAKPYLSANQAVGVDEGDTAKSVSDFFKNEQIPCAYANGTSSPFASPEKFKRLIQEAITLRSESNDLKLVYTWTVNSLKTMRNFIDTGVDGMITDKADRLKKLIESEYKDKIKLATSDHNPFA
jgi:hypothetical protein